MSTKTKNQKSVMDNVTDSAMQTGVLLMTAAVTLGLVDIPSQPDKKAVLPMKPVFAFAGEQGEQGTTLRREREETGPHYISYNISQRTPGRTGKI